MICEFFTPIFLREISIRFVDVFVAYFFGSHWPEALMRFFGGPKIHTSQKT